MEEHPIVRMCSRHHRFFNHFNGEWMYYDGKHQAINDVYQGLQYGIENQRCDKCAKEQDESFDFGEALKKMREGKRVSRRRWERERFYCIGIRAPSDEERMRMPLKEADPWMTDPYIYVCQGVHHYVPWSPRHDDLLAQDWHEIE